MPQNETPSGKPTGSSDNLADILRDPGVASDKRVDNVRKRLDRAGSGENSAPIDPNEGGAPARNVSATALGTPTAQPNVSPTAFTGKKAPELSAWIKERMAPLNALDEKVSGQHKKIIDDAYSIQGSVAARGGVIDERFARLIHVKLGDEPDSLNNVTWNQYTDANTRNYLQKETADLRESLEKIIVENKSNAAIFNKYATRLRHHPKTHKALMALRVLGGLFAGAYGLLAAVAGLKKGEPINAASLAGVGLMGLLFGAFKRKGTLIDLQNNKETQQLFARNEFNGSDESNRILRFIAARNVKEIRKIKEAVATKNKGALLEITKQDQNIADFLLASNMNDLDAIHNQSNRWLKSGSITDAGKMLKNIA